MKIEVQVYQIFGSNANLVGDNNDLEHCDLYLQNLETYDINNKLNQNGQIKLSKKVNSHFKRRKILLRIIYPYAHRCRVCVS